MCVSLLQVMNTVNIANCWQSRQVLLHNPYLRCFLSIPLSSMLHLQAFIFLTGRSRNGIQPCFAFLPRKCVYLTPLQNLFSSGGHKKYIRFCWEKSKHVPLNTRLAENALLVLFLFSLQWWSSLFFTLLAWLRTSSFTILTARFRKKSKFLLFPRKYLCLHTIFASNTYAFHFSRLYPSRRTLAI